MTLEVRLAQLADVPALNALIERSARQLSIGYYTAPQIDAVVRHVFGVDTRLIEDQTYFMILDDGQPAGCGGWSRRRTLYGGDQRPMGGVDWLDPAVDAAKIRAFFVAPEFARRGVGRQLLASCEAAARDAGYSSLELMATLPGVPFYSALGFKPVRDVTDVLPDGTAIEFVHMQRPVAPE
jgi:GNAT superfamily N-acetyltransferase